MSTAQVTHLSLLSRGVGEVQIGIHEKIEVKLEPEDYNNWLDDTRRVWNVPAVLPPIQQSSQDPQFHHSRDDITVSQYMTESDTHRSRDYPAISHDSALSKVYLPKTFTTRKGALLLFSEDFANKQLSGSNQHNLEKNQSGSVPELRTVDDLAKSILAYGATKSFQYSDESRDDIYLGFVHTKSRKYYERQYKPGFSAKRYLSSWSKLWDYSLLNKLTNKGYLKPVPHQKKSDYDVSGIPLPYRILRQWLFAPGSIDGYTFYRQSKAVESREPTIVVIEETPRPVSLDSEMSQGSIKVSSLLANKELNYGELDSSTKESILTELLVKSAITHAIKKQKEYQETVSKHFEDEELKRKASARLYEFDMMNAIQTALESSVIPTVSTFNLDPHGLIPEKEKTKKDKKGFRGTKGFGLQPSATAISVGSAGSVRSSLETKHQILPPIPREELRVSKPLTLGQHFPSIPTLRTHYDAPPSTVADEDEEYHKWRESVLTPEKRQAAVADGSNTSVLSKQKSKSSQSVSKVSLDSDLHIEHKADAADTAVDSTNNQLNLTSNNSNAASEAVINVIAANELERELSAVGLDNDHDLDDKKSVISTMSMLSMTSKRSRFSSTGYAAPYTKGITSRQDPNASLLKVDMIASEFDPTAAITSWRYQVEQEEPYTKHVGEEENVEEQVVETKLETTPVPMEVEESVSSISVPVVHAPPSPDSIPPASDHCTPSPVPSSIVSTKPPTPVEPEQPAEISESEFMEALTDQAREIAKAVLEQNPDAGMDLAVDAKNAAELLMSNLPDGQTTETTSRAPSQSADSAEDLVDEQPPEPQTSKNLWKLKLSSDASGTGVDGGQVDGSATVGQLVKEGLENLVSKIDEYVMADESTAEESAAQTPSIATATPSVPGTHAHTPSIKSSRHSSAPLEVVDFTTSATGSAMDEYAHSIPTADGETPSQSRATKFSATRLSSADDAAPGTSRVASTSLSGFMSQRSSAAGDAGIDTAETAVPGSSESKKGGGSATGSKKSSSGSATTPKKNESKVQHETEFVVGKVADKTELQQLYAPIEPPTPPKSKTKGGKAKPIVPKPSPPKKEPVKKEPAKKVEKPAGKKPAKKAGSRKEKKGKASNTPGKTSTTSADEKPPTPVKTPKPPTPVAPVVEPKEPTPEPEEEEWKTPEPEVEPDMEFVIVRDEFSDEEEEKPQLGLVKSLNYASDSPEASAGTLSTADEEEALPPGVSNRDAQAAKRAAAKEKRRRDMERRRKEREDAIKKEREDAERKERIRLQMEEERLRREEEIRLKKEMEREERERLEMEEEAKLKAERDAHERERKRQEERARILEEKKRRMLEEEERRRAQQTQKEAEEAERLRLEQEMLKAMAEEERAEYLQKKEEEERLRAIAEEQARIKREEESRRIMEELQRQDAERRRAEEILRQRLMFQRSLNVEAHGMDHSQDITRAFVFSYYELLKWLGYEVPEWAQYGSVPSADFVYNNHPERVNPDGPDAEPTQQLSGAADSASNHGHMEH